MGGKGSGRYKHSEEHVRKQAEQRRARAYEPVDGSASLNARIMQFGMDLMELEAPDYADEAAMRARLREYFGLCERHGVKPMVSSMAQAFGMDRRVLWGIATGHKDFRHYKGITPASSDVLQKAYTFLQTNLEISLMEETKNPVKWFFLAKNYFGYEDQTVHVQRQEGEGAALPSPDEVAAKYALQVGRDRDPLEVEADVSDVPRGLPEPGKGE